MYFFSRDTYGNTFNVESKNMLIDCFFFTNAINSHVNLPASDIAGLIKVLPIYSNVALLLSVTFCSGHIV